MATDETVTIGIFGETNVDEIAESISDAMDDLSQSTEIASEAADDVERSLEDASESMDDAASSAALADEKFEQAGQELGELGVVAETVSEPLQDTENEIEDIGQDSLVATSQISGLTASLQALDSQNVDVDVDTDTNIGELLEESGATGNFLQAVASSSDLDIPERNIAQSAELGLRSAREAGGSLPQVVAGINEVTDESIGYKDILESLQGALVSTQESAEKAIGSYDTLEDKQRSVTGRLSIPADLLSDDEFRGSLLDRLDENVGLGAGQKGGISTALLGEERDFADPETLARRLAEFEGIDQLSAIDAVQQAQRERRGGPVSRKDIGIPSVRRIPQLGEQTQAGLSREELFSFQTQEDAFQNALAPAATSAQNLADETDSIINEEIREFREKFAEAGVAAENVKEKADGFTDDIFDEFPDVDDIDTSGVFEEIDDAVSEDDISDILGQKGSVRDLRSRILSENVDAFKELELATRQDIGAASEVGRFRERDIGQLLDIDVLDFESQLAESLSDEFEGFDRDQLRSIVETGDETTVGSIVSSVERTAAPEGERLDTFDAAEGVQQALSDAARATAIVDGDKESAEEASTTFGKLSAAVGVTNTSLGALIAFSNASEEGVEELDDDVKELTRSISTLAPAINNLSANLGPFNIGLSNLAITIPALIASLGPLLAVAGALVGTIVALAGAVAGLLAVGAIGFVEELKQNFASVESTGDALTAIFNGLKEALKVALAPLEDVQIGGVGPMGLFMTVLQDVVTLVHLFAEAAAELLEMDVVQDFLLNMRAAVLGFGNATDDGIGFMEGLKIMVRETLPVLEGLLLWFINALPEFMKFTGVIIDDLAPALGDVSLAFIRLAAVLSKVGTGVLPVLLQALALTFNVMAVGLELFLKLLDVLGPIGDAIGATIVVVGALTIAMIKLISTGITFISVYNEVTDLIDELGDESEESAVGVSALNMSMTTLVKRGIVLVAGIALIVASLKSLNETFPVIGKSFNAVISLISDTIEGFLEWTDSVSKALGVSEEWDATLRVLGTTLKVLIDIIALVTGIMLVYIAVTGKLGLVSTSTSASQSGLAASILRVGTAMKTVVAIAAPLLALIGLLATSINLFTTKSQGATGALKKLAGAIGIVASVGGGVALLASKFAVIAQTVGVIASLMGVVTGSLLLTAAIVGGIVATIALAGAILTNWILNLEKSIDKFERVWEILTDIQNNGTLIEVVLALVAKGIISPILLLLKSVKILKEIIKTVGSALGSDDKGGGGATSDVGFFDIIGPRTFTPVSLDKGGFVEDSGLAMLHSNEYVIPADKMGSIGANANVGAMPETQTQTTNTSGDTYITVNVDNSDGEFDDRKARKIGRIANKEARKNRRQTEGR
jgi:hypothetical protein